MFAIAGKAVSRSDTLYDQEWKNFIKNATKKHTMIGVLHFQHDLPGFMPNNDEYIRGTTEKKRVECPSLPIHPDHQTGIKGLTICNRIQTRRFNLIVKNIIQV